MNAPTPGQDLVSLVEGFRGRRILVYADLVADEFVLTGEPRVSREAPVLILRYRESRIVPGGGANAAANIATLGGVPVIVGEVGDDDVGRELLAGLRALGAETEGVLIREAGATPRKTRILAGGKHVALQQVARIDRVDPFLHDEPFLREVKSRVVQLLDDVHGILVSDYGVGFVDPESVDALILQAPARKTAKVVLDSRYRLLEYVGVDVAAPSEPELEAALGRSLDRESLLETAGRDALERLRAEALVLTRGSLGLQVFPGGEPTETIEAFGHGTVADVTGAGDTVVATLSLALAAGAGPRDAARLANIAAGIVVTKMGTATLSADELLEALRRDA